MAVFRLKPDADWAPITGQGRGRRHPSGRSRGNQVSPVTSILLPDASGTKINKRGRRMKEFVLPPNRQITVVETHQIKALDIDPRFTRIS